MLYREAEKRIRDEIGIREAAGTCRFCGQIMACKALEEWSQEEVDELAAETCECLDARIYSRRKEKKEKASEKIELLFGKDNEDVEVPAAAVELLHRAAHQICEGSVKKINVDIGNGIGCRISVTSKGFIKVERKRTDVSAYEA